MTKKPGRLNRKETTMALNKAIFAGFCTAPSTDKKKETNDKTLRKVIVSHVVGYQQEGTHRLRYVLEPQGEAMFHQFGVSYEEFEAGPGNYTTAIVEWPDGRVESVVAEHVRFVPHKSEPRLA